MRDRDAALEIVIAAGGRDPEAGGRILQGYDTEEEAIAAGKTRSSSIDVIFDERITSASGPSQIIDETRESPVLRRPGEEGPIPDHVLAARLAKSNMEDLQRMLGPGVTPAEVYLAHVLGSGTAAKVIKAAETAGRTKLTSLVSKEKLSTNKHLAGMTAADALNWAGKRIQDAAEEISGMIDGREIGPDYSALPLDKAIAFGKRLSTATSDAAIQMGGIVASDIASIRSSGVPAEGLTDEQVSAAFAKRPAAYANWVEDREDAFRYWGATGDMDEALRLKLILALLH